MHIDLQQYVPTVSTSESVSAPGESGDSAPDRIHVDQFHHLAIGKLSTVIKEEEGSCKFPHEFCTTALSGGDQMTAARTRSSQRIHSGGQTGGNGTSSGRLALKSISVDYLEASSSIRTDKREQQAKS